MSLVFAMALIAFAPHPDWTSNATEPFAQTPERQRTNGVMLKQPHSHSPVAHTFDFPMTHTLGFELDQILNPSPPSTDRVLRRPTIRLRDAAVLSFITLCEGPTMFCIGWLAFGNLLYEVSPITINGLPEDVRDEVIWADRVELFQTYLPITIAISVVVAPIVFFLKLAMPAPSTLRR